MAYIGNFDAETIAPQTELTALPSGEYLMAITDSEMKPTKTNSGQYLQLVFTVFDAPIPEYKGRKIFVRLNLINSNQTAVDIAQRELSAICHALGILKITDSAQLHDRPLCCKVVFVPAKGEFAESNKISAYKPAHEYGHEHGKAPLKAPLKAPAPPHLSQNAVVAPVSAPPSSPLPRSAPWRKAPAPIEAEATA